MKFAHAIPILCAATMACSCAVFVGLPSQAVDWQSLRKAAGMRNSYEIAYEEAWQIVRDNYFDRDKLSDWDTWRHAYDGRLRNRTQLRSAIRAMLASLHDDYTYLLSDDDVAERARDTKDHGSVSADMIADGIAYIQISNLKAQDVAAEFKHAMKRLSAASGFIIDLRDNHGGFIDIANRVFAMLVQRGTFLIFQGRQDGAPDAEQVALTRDACRIDHNGKVDKHKRLPDLSGGKPIVVLVNGDTRSAAELLAGALRDNKRATVVGTRTFGKGVLQDSYEVTSGIEMKVVTAGYFLPRGNSINNRGLIPDVVIGDGNGGEDPQLQKALSIVRDAAHQMVAGQPAVSADQDNVNM